MTDDMFWTQSLPGDIQETIASYEATNGVDVMAVLKREKLLRRAVSYLTWDDVVASGVGIRNNSFGMEPETALDLMDRPEAGLLFVGGFFTDLGIPSILRHRELEDIDEYRRRIRVTRKLIDAINAGEVVETRWEFIANGWLLTRARDRLAEFGPKWSLNPMIVNPVIEMAQQKLEAQTRDTDVAFQQGASADLIDYAAHKQSKMRHNSGAVGTLMRKIVSRK